VEREDPGSRHPGPLRRRPSFPARDFGMPAARTPARSAPKPGAPGTSRSKNPSSQTIRNGTRNSPEPLDNLFIRWCQPHFRVLRPTVAAGHAGHIAAMASEAGPLTVDLSAWKSSGRADQRVPTGSMTPSGRREIAVQGTDGAMEPYSRRLAQHRRRTRRSATYPRSGTPRDDSSHAMLAPRNDRL
jgi:hypothetical protein